MKGTKGKTIALRADIDALEIKELNENSYASVNEGLMHACGHDAHTASLLGAAKVLKGKEKDLNGTVKLFFQQAEEIGQGADHFDVKKFDAEWAYTMDGGEIGELEFENFNAASA